jgi:outer membrane biosynthesis protein TonB
MRGLRQRVEVTPLGGIGLAGTLGIHLAVVATFLAAGATRPRPLAPIAYRVSLIAAPPPGGAPAAASAAPPAATPPAPAPKPSAPAVRTPAPTPTPAVSHAAPAPAAAKPAPAAAPPAGAAAPHAAAATPGAPTAVTGPAGSTTAGADPATIRTEGVEFPFPGYLRNLVSQVYQRWRPPPSQASLVAEILFFLHRDGSVTGLQFIRRSGSFGFDLEAQGAIESASRAGAFGALPDGFGPDVLPVSFFFNPRGR